MQRSPVPLRVQLFVAPKVEVDGVAAASFQSRKAIELLALLCLSEGRDLERGVLAEILWPHKDREQSFANLRQALLALHDLLGGKSSSRVRSPRSPRVIGLDLDGAAIDVLEFDALVARGDEGSLNAATQLYRGPLLEGCTADWIHDHRDRRHAAWTASLEKLARMLMSRDELELAHPHLERLVRAEPWSESANCALMNLHARCGRLVEAIQVYASYRAHLNKELRTEPGQAARDRTQRSAATRALGPRPPPPILRRAGPQRPPRKPASATSVCTESSRSARAELRSSCGYRRCPVNLIRGGSSCSRAHRAMTVTPSPPVRTQRR